MADRYTAQLRLPEIGKQGQQQLAKARVLCIGAGGLAAGCLPALVAAGVGQITIVDDDLIVISNLNRQVWFTAADCDQPKAMVLANRLHQLNPDCQLTAIVDKFTAHNAHSLVADHDLVLDCCDDYPSKLLINFACQRLKRPWIYASVLGWDGQVAYFNPCAANAACLKCWQPGAPLASGSCATSGVLGAAVNLVASYQASLAIQALLGETGQAQKLWVFDLWQLTAQSFAIAWRDSCRYHGHDQLAYQYGLSYPDALITANLKLIDIRSSDEWSSGGLADAVHLPLATLLAEHAVRFRQSDSVVVYCQHDSLSRLAVANLRELGYQAWWLRGGYQANCTLADQEETNENDN